MKTATIVRRSFNAMFWGWVACNAALWLGLIGTELARNHNPLKSVLWWGLLGWMIYVFIATGIVILVAWLFFFLPADLLVKESSFLRLPRWAGPCGGLVGYMSVFVPLVLATDAHLDALVVFGLLAGICGLTASLHLVLHHPRTDPAAVPVSLSTHDRSVL